METSANTVDLRVVDQLYREFTQELLKIKSDDPLYTRLAEAIHISKVFVRKLREYIQTRSFEPGQEIVICKIPYKEISNACLLPRTRAEIELEDL